MIKKQLLDLLKNVPYREMTEVERELISEGLPEEEVLKLCDIHGMVLDGAIGHSGEKSPRPAARLTPLSTKTRRY